MLATNGRLKIAVQKSGRLTSDSQQLLKACGLEFELDRQALYTPCRNFELDILAVRDDDIPEYVQDGVADLGIVGRNIIVEHRADVRTLLELGFGVCRLMICIPDKGPVQTLQDLQGKRIATTYPGTLQQFLEREGLHCSIVHLSGAVELAPTLDVADVICDIVSTGSTARVNGLRPIFTVLESQSLLIANAEALADATRRETIDRLMTRINGTRAAYGKRYMMLNAPREALEEIERILPSLRSPTVVPLADDGMVAIHSVIGEDTLWEVMEQLKKAGASDIVVTPIESIIE